MGIRVKVRIEGVREILRALDELPTTAQNEVRDGSMRLATILARQVRAAGEAEPGPAKYAARTVKAKRDRVPVITAGVGGPRKGKAVLFATEFGQNRKSGWYRKVRYFNSAGAQFKPHRGAASYWFFRTVEDEQEIVSASYRNMINVVARKWGEGG